MASNPPETDTENEDAATDEAATDEAATDEAATDEAAPDAAAADAVEEATDGESPEQSFSPDELADNGAQAGKPPADVNLDLILDVPVSVTLRVGSTEISIRDLVQLVEGSVVALDRESSEPMDVMVNGTLIAHGEIVVVDEKFGVRLTDVVSPAERIRNINQDSAGTS